MTLKLPAGLVVLFIALVLQFWFASFGWYLDLAFAAVISFAFIFDFWPFMVLLLAAVFILNWKPTASIEILVFALYPIAAHFSRSLLHWATWLVNVFAIFAGFLILYLVAGHGTLRPAFFIPDVVAGMLFGAISLLLLHQWQ